MSRRITLRNIAEALDLSVSSVSLALRGHPRIPEATTLRVRQEAARLGYIYNRAAADLRKAESRLVAVCLSDLSNPVFNEFLERIEDELRRHDRTVFLGVARESAETQARFLKTALEHGVGGIVLCPVHGTRAQDLDMLLPLGPMGRPAVPTVVFSRALCDVALPQFLNDDDLSGRMAVELLVGQGHRRIAWLGGGQETSTARGRFGGFQKALAATDLAEPEVRHGPTTREFGRAATLSLLQVEAPPTALVCFSDLIAFGALAAIRECGLVPGRDVSVVGCDDMDEAGFTWPGLSTIKVDKAGIGRAVAHCLLGLGEAEGRILPPRLIDRGTVGPVPHV